MSATIATPPSPGRLVPNNDARGRPSASPTGEDEPPPGVARLPTLRADDGRSIVIGQMPIQRSDNIAEFWLSGFNAVASASGEVLTFASDTPVPFDSIEIEALRQPGGGAIDISLDGAVKSSADLGGTAVEPVVLRLRPDRKSVV